MFAQDCEGREFMFSVPTNIKQSSGQKQVRLYITSQFRTEVKIYVKYNAYRNSFFTLPNDVATFDIPVADAEVSQIETDINLPQDEVINAKAVHIIAHDPIAVYCVNQDGLSGDGIRVVPVQQLGRIYAVHGDKSGAAPSQLLITGVYNETLVNISMPKGRGTVSHDSENFSYTINLKRGDVYNAFASKGTVDFSGAIINSNRPVAVTCGTQCIARTGVSTPCEYAATMLLPMSNWGKRFFVQSFKNSPLGERVRVYAFDEYTKISINGVVDTTLNVTKTELLATYRDYDYLDSNFIISADKPISVVQTNRQTQSLDYPYLVPLTPQENFQNSYKFVAPTSGFQNHYLSVIGEGLSITDLQAYNTITKKYENPTPLYTLVSNEAIPNSNVTGFVFKIKSGYHEIVSKKPFTGSNYGDVASQAYGFPLMTDVKSDLAKDTEKPRIDIFTKQCNGKITGAFVEMPRIDSINRKLIYLELLSTSQNYTLSFNEFIVGETDSIQFSLNPIDVNKPALAHVAVCDVAGNINYDTVRYEPLNQIKFSAKKIDFGFADLATPVRKKIKIYKALIDSISMVLKFENDKFKIVSPVGKFNLYNTDSVEIEVEFSSNVAGEFADSLGFKDDCGNFFFAALSAKVFGSPVIEVTDINFGTVTKGQKVTNFIKVKNSATDPSVLLITDVKNPYSNDFSIVDNIQPTLPIRIASGEEKEFYVSFTPNSIRTYSDSIVFYSNASALDNYALLRGVCEPYSVEMDIQIIPEAKCFFTNNVFNLELTSTKEIDLSTKIYNEIGAEVLDLGIRKFSMGKNFVKSDLFNSPKGAYLLVLKDKQNKIRKVKFVK